MKTMFLLLVIATVLFFVLKAKKNGNATDEKRATAPYFGKAPLSEPEQVLFHRLREAMPDKIILAQVAMPALVGIRKNANWQRQFNEISRKYVDFAICHADLTVKAVIELDDSTHQRGERIKADAIKDAAFKIINCPVIRFDVRNMPSIEQIQKALTA